MPVRYLPFNREITTDDYQSRNYHDDIDGTAWIASTARIRELLERQHAGAFRLPLVLREAIDLQPNGRPDPSPMFSYDMGPSMVTTEVEVVIETMDGRRHAVPKTAAPWDGLCPTSSSNSQGHVLSCIMSRRLFAPLSILIFFPICAAFCAQLWPFVTGRPVPESLDDDLLLIGSVALLLSGGVAMVFTASQSDRGVRP